MLGKVCKEFPSPFHFHNVACAFEREEAGTRNNLLPHYGQTPIIDHKAIERVTETQDVFGHVIVTNYAGGFI